MIAAALIAAAAFAAKPCAPPLNDTVARCGSVADLNVVIVPAVGSGGTMPPLFHLEGGPGIPATNAAPFYIEVERAYHETRDVVMIDARGTGRSAPLHCPAIEKRPELEDEFTPDAVAECLATMPKDVDAYSTERAAADIDTVRQALGAEKIDIAAISYGTRLAQVYMKRYPSHVNRVILVGFAKLDYKTPLFHAAHAQRVLDLLFFKCQTDADCSAKYPRLRAEWQKVLATVDHRGPFTEAVRTSLTTAAGQRALPSMIHAAANGDFGPFRKRFSGDHSLFADGLYLTIACSEGSSRIAPDDVGRYTAGTFVGDYRVTQELSACAHWPTYKLPADFYDPPKQGGEVLVLAGEMDVVTPPEWGRTFCSSLPRCRFIEIPDLGHGPFDLEEWKNGGCFDDVAAAFYRDGTAGGASCIGRMQPPPFR